MSNQLTAKTSPIYLGFSAMVLVSSVTLPAQAFNLVQNGGFTPSNVLPFRSSGINNPSSGVNIPGWTVTDNPNKVSGYVNNLMYVVSDGNTFSAEGGVGMNAKGDNQRKSWTLFGTPGQTVNSVDGSGWYIASDGDPKYSGSISQTVSGLTVGSEYKVSFSQAAGQFDCNFGSKSDRSSICLESGIYFGATTDLWRVTFGNSTQDSTLMNLASQAPVTPWQQQTLTFTADSPTQVLSFLAVGTPAAMPPTALLSGVSVEPVPEPLTILGSVAALGFGAYAERKRKTSKSLKKDNTKTS